MNDRLDLAPWGITATASERAPLGLNNDSYFVSTRTGEYVLRVYRNTADANRVRDEHHLLGLLAVADLPFAAPTPVRTVAGDTVAVLESASGPYLSALFHRIPGEPADITTRNARLAAGAMARLDRALAGVRVPLRAPATLRDVHLAVPDVDEAVQELPLPADHLRELARIVERVQADHDPIVSSLPAQIVHGDFAYGNVLLADGRVTGVLDFEFAGPDVRAADLATALYVTVVRGAAADRWELVDALAAGYRRGLPLDPTELAALPALMLRRSAVGLVHWLGRWRQGIAAVDEPVDRATRIVAFARWLDEHAGRLVAVAAGAVAPSTRTQRP